MTPLEMLVAAVAALVALLVSFFKGKKSGERKAQAAAAGELSKVKEVAINEEADRVQHLDRTAKYDAVLERFLRRRKVERKNSGDTGKP